MNTYKFIPAKNYFAGWRQMPVLIVIHWTAGSFKSAVDTFESGIRQASAHFVVDINGEAVQMVQLKDRSWHAGVSNSRFGSGANNYAFGIELAGPPSFVNQSCWNIAQLHTAANICKFIASQFPTVKFITDHSFISPGRKIDVRGNTGKAIDVFPWEDFVKMTSLEDLK
jgi:N-acetyl-anhydromuramyl-L-alanine amidase AmpD